MKTFFTFENLEVAYLDCRKRKTRTLNHLAFAENLEENLLDLEKNLQNRTYKPGRSIAFVVQKPKIREIFAADFRDRVVHHLLFNYLSPIFEKIFIYDSWACRKGKGTHGAMLRLREFACKLERERERERESPSTSLRICKERGCHSSAGWNPEQQSEFLSSNGHSQFFHLHPARYFIRFGQKENQKP